jgi:hypothetical protein
VSRFNTRAAKAAPAKAFIVTDTRASGRTALGAPGFARDVKGELFLLAVTNMVGEKTFHEDGLSRDARYRALIREAAVQDSVWTARLLGWLRSTANMRTASVVGGLEAAKAMVEAGVPGGRAIVDSVLQRADEPGEALAYWMSTYGRTIPKPVKRGIADAAQRLYTEFTLLKYDTGSHGVRFADVLDLTHPDAKAPWQSDLFRFALARRHGRDEEPGELLTMIRNNARLRKAAAERPEALLNWHNVKEAGFTWEDALSLAGNKVNKAKLWEAMIPNMGYMACLRNLRNFTEVGIDNATRQFVVDKLTDPEQVARSRQFPFRFLSAHRATAQSLQWAYPLEQALNLSVSNVPELSGRTLILVDRSGSMFDAIAGSTELTRADAAAVFGGALALRNYGRATLVQFGTGSAEVPVGRNESLLKLVEKFRNMGGTYTAAATRAFYKGHDRVVLVTDEQSYDGDPGAVIPANIPLYVWDLAGYKYGHTPGVANRYTFGGLTDASFQLIPLLERGVGGSGSWPWEQVN